ncbi:patatin-like phospholipase family protein [Mariniflexile litorale]|uniref:Patatin-like phospholipase family protein n=1 Tax=Mariniflexile litorale TaxID=3045158 RepID=A0AAU7EEP1_9FLAO|nr:patatin-like phospholipase family protein [Mariniflexile sp. KMM 9835]MDQ8212346.1 patatin-like phospholipase family protein [Mariniflexile sp. KMM 9835]
MGDNFIPFKSIGLCFSGGGYRATFFALGVVSYLDKIKYQNGTLLENVEAISTVSGGTLLGIAYAKAAQEPDFNFKAFFKTFYNRFEPVNDTLLETAIQKLEDDTVWESHPNKKRSLINAFALTYADMDLFKGNFEPFKKPISKHLKHVCFNATDFSFGLAFRFQNTGVFGNSPLKNTHLNALKYDVQLGDIVASSSCFPLGFEPLIFPDDYFKNQNTTDYKALKSLDRFMDGVGIMDGGITDNQGIGSMINISDQKSRQRPLDLIIVNDVGSFKMDPWQQNTATIKKSSSLKQSISKILKYFQMKPLYWVTLVIGIVIVVGNSLKLLHNTAFTALYILGSMIMGIGLTLTFLGVIAGVVKKFGTHWFKNVFRKNIPEALIDDVAKFDTLNINLIQQMLTDRLTSTVKMVNDIFLKQIRRLNYDLLYSKASLKHKIITATVYELNGEKTAYTTSFKHNIAIKPAPSKLLKDIGLTASKTPTTLWWDKTDVAKNRMDTLIACGQFTTCYKLLDYILELKKDAETQDIDTKAIDDLYHLLLKDWKAFNEDPLFVLEILNL